ncbi:MAG TPA: hypothetical protein PLU71_01445 [Candidatus Dependentiae bacterium]|nr:hypothetical protein [Candidatus Dependentiae bacterium]HRQ62496.1 hypothetical protein [Candidatus Dependentiae bacterium]
MNLKNRSLIFLVALLGCSSINLKANIYAGSFTLDGHLNQDTLKINAQRFYGYGTIEGKNITIKCEEFKFKGTIISHGKCIIHCDNPFDYSSFAKKGTGIIVVVKGPYSYDVFSDPNITKEFMLDDLVNITDEVIDNRIKSIRNYARLNEIDEKIIFDSLVKTLDDEIKFHKDHIDEIYDQSHLIRVLIGSSLTLVGLIATGIFTMNLKKPDMGLAASSAFMSCIPFFNIALPSLPFMYEQHDKKIDKLIIVKECINQALCMPYIPETDQQVIKLQ